MIDKVLKVGSLSEYASARVAVLGGGYQQPVNTTVDGCAVTITTRYEAIGPTNIINTAHYPMTVVLIEYDLS